MLWCEWQYFQYHKQFSARFPISTSHHCSDCLFLYFKNFGTMQWVHPKNYAIGHNWVKKWVVNHLEYARRQMWFNISNQITYSAQFFCYQVNVVSPWQGAVYGNPKKFSRTAYRNSFIVVYNNFHLIRISSCKVYKLCFGKVQRE
jgi:hypothetical protein